MTPEDATGWTGAIIFVAMLFALLAAFGVLAYLTDRRDRPSDRDDGSPTNR